VQIYDIRLIDLGSNWRYRTDAALYKGVIGLCAFFVLFLLVRTEICKEREMYHVVTVVVMCLTHEHSTANSCLVTICK
jgi:hypothetical protein